MANKTNIKLNKPWVRNHLCDVTNKKIAGERVAWVFIQEPGFIGFGIVQHNGILWPPNKPENSPDWCLVSDLRLFGEKGEWHVWRDWDGKHQCRLLEFNEKDEWNIWLGEEGKTRCAPEKSGKNADILLEYHALWGTKVKSVDSHWIRLIEDRGTEIWLPLAKLKLKDDKDLPLRLKLKQVVDYDPEYHLAGIVDAALVGLVRNSDEELLLPIDLRSCS